MATIFRPPLVTKRFARPGLRGVSEVGRNIALLTAVVVVAAPFAQHDWPNPQARESRVHLDASRGAMPAYLLQGEKPSGAALLELPGTPRHARDYTHLQRSILAEPPPAEPPTIPQDLANPRTPDFPQGLLTWLHNGTRYQTDNMPPATTLLMVPSRRSYAAAIAPQSIQRAIYYPTGPVVAPFAQHFWPNPARRKFSHVYFGYTDRAQLEYYPAGTTMLPLQYSRGKFAALLFTPQAEALRASIVQAPPFRPVDAPNPRGKRYPVVLRTSLSSLPLPFASGPKPPLVYDWPNPRGPRRASTLNTWLYTLQGSTLAPPVIKPVGQAEWRVPPRKRFTSYYTTMLSGFRPSAHVPLKPVGDPYMAARIQVQPKLPAEVRAETFDASPFLQINQAISSVAGAIGVYSGTDPDYADVLGSVTYNGNSVTVMLDGGVQGVIYIVTIYLSATNPTETVPVSFFLAIAPELP